MAVRIEAMTISVPEEDNIHFTRTGLRKPNVIKEEPEAGHEAVLVS
jgi:hypothetical protein